MTASANDMAFVRTVQRLRPDEIPFRAARTGEISLELELQIVNRRDFDLATEAEDLLRLAEDSAFVDQLEPEITRGMIDFSSRVHARAEGLGAEVDAFVRSIAREAARLNVAVAGGGAHPFQRWQQQRIYATPHFARVHEKFGYLAKQYTVFGQHIHIGVESGDDAVFLTRALARYVPHFIALSASSPFVQGEDTGYDSARSHAVNAFPTSGTMPMCVDWMAFEAHVARLKAYGVIEGVGDLYWDIRPQPDRGTVQVRVLDAPYVPRLATLLAVYASVLARWLLDVRPTEHHDAELVYAHNRFQAARHGLRGQLARPGRADFLAVYADVSETLTALRASTADAYEDAALVELAALAERQDNGASWARRTWRSTGCLNDVVRLAAAAFSDRTTP